MHIKVLSIEKTKMDPFYTPDSYMEEWDPGVNARIFINSGYGKATLFYQGEKLTSNGWVANPDVPKRYGWNFSEAHKLKSEEPSRLVFSHLFPNKKQTWAVNLFIEGDSKYRSMVDLATEITFQIEIQRRD